MDPQEVKDRFGKRLRTLRQARSLTQQALGEISGVGYKYLGSIERGEQNPSLDVIARLAAGLEVDVQELFDFNHEVDSSKELQQMIEDLLEDAKIEELQQVVRHIKAVML